MDQPLTQWDIETEFERVVNLAAVLHVDETTPEDGADLDERAKTTIRTLKVLRKYRELTSQK